jgi:DMSO/TMAO reductase YedYZ molybdopterin-dependent catalytic subunit
MNPNINKEACMKKKKTRELGLNELYARDPEKADRDLWGRIADPVTRRGFLRKSGLYAMTAFLGAAIPFERLMPSGLIPASIAYATEPVVIPGKNGLVLVQDRPLNAETLPHFLDDEVTPTERLFIRNNGIPPEGVDAAAWTFTVDGESVEKQMTFTIDELKKKFKHYTLQLQLECGGNGRASFNPPVKGNQWTLGAVGCPEWTGVRLKDVLNACGVKKDAVYIGYHGADQHLSGDPTKAVISRGVPIAKAMEDESMIVWAMNGVDMPLNNGHPLRLMTAGWAGSTCGKWLKRISVGNKVHDGAKMAAPSYRVPCNPVGPGEDMGEGLKDNNVMCVLGSMPVKSLITHPETGKEAALGAPFEVRGHAWAGDLGVAEMNVSIDFGATWTKCDLKRPKNRLAWQRWSARINFPTKGYYEVWAKATDESGKGQPMVVPGWNPEGYLNNSCHRIAVKVV